MEKKKSPVALRIISVLLLIGWMGLIFYLSHQNADDSSLLSGGLIKKVASFIFPNLSSDSLENLVASLQFIVRKGAHFSLYGVLGVLAFVTVITYSKIHLAVRVFISFLISAFYAMSDEYHQTFIKGRSGEIRDVIIDCSGALLGILIALAIYGLRNVIKNRRSGKMKKKQYIELTEELTSRLRAEKRLGAELREENNALMEQLKELRTRVAVLERCAQPDVKPVASVISITPESPVVSESVKIPQPVEVLKPIEYEEVDLSDAVSEGAKIIGKIVLSSAEYCNKLTGVGAGQNTKELVNLILGRTEVAKGEILRLTALDIDPKDRLAAMEREQNEAEDYFKSVMAQK